MRRKSWVPKQAPPHIPELPTSGIIGPKAKLLPLPSQLWLAHPLLQAGTAAFTKNAASPQRSYGSKTLHTEKALKYILLNKFFSGCYSSNGRAYKTLPMSPAAQLYHYFYSGEGKAKLD